MLRWKIRDFRPLNEEEQKIIQKAQRIIGKSSTIPCTACHYCIEGCPKKIPIPDIFSAVNLQLGNGQIGEALEAYRSMTKKGGLASSYYCEFEKMRTDAGNRLEYHKKMRS